MYPFCQMEVLQLLAPIALYVPKKQYGIIFSIVTHITYYFIVQFQMLVKMVENKRFDLLHKEFQN